MRPHRAAGFTLVEVLVALMVVALGLAALMTAVSSAARASASLRDKTVAQWIALNRITEVRLTVNKIAQTSDTGQIDMANRTWHYDTRYFDTSVPTMRRIIVRVWAGDSKTAGNPVAEATGFMGTALGQPGTANNNWSVGTTLATGPNTATPGTTTPGTTPGTTTPGATAPGTGTTGTGTTGSGAGTPGSGQTTTP